MPADLAAKITEYTAVIGGRLGRALPFAPAIAIDTGRGPKGTLAEAEPATAAGAPAPMASGPAAGCLVTIYEGSLSPGETDNTIAHEVFHCYQFALDAGQLPEWFAEGSAEWVGTEIAGPDRTTRGNWDEWLGDPGRALFRREHEALGFFAVLEQQGLDPWTAFDAMQRTADRLSSQGIYNLAKERLGEEPALDVAMAATREPSLGTDWDSAGPGITRTRATYEDRIGAGRSVDYRAPISGLYGTASVVLRPSGDVLTLSGASGFDTAVAFPATDTTIGNGLTGSWCIKPGGCLCPPGSPRRPDLLAGAPGKVGIALAQPDDRRANVTFTAETRSLDDWCAGEPLDLTKLCDLLTPAEVAGAIGDPSATRGELTITSPRNAFCAYPKNDGFQALTLNGFRSKDVEADFQRLVEFTPGVRDDPLTIGGGGVLQYHGTTGNDLYVKVPGGYLVIQSSKTNPPRGIPSDWVDERLGAALTGLASLAVGRVGTV